MVKVPDFYRSFYDRSLPVPKCGMCAFLGHTSHFLWEGAAQGMVWNGSNFVYFFRRYVNTKFSQDRLNFVQNTFAFCTKHPCFLLTVVLLIVDRCDTIFYVRHIPPLLIWPPHTWPLGPKGGLVIKQAMLAGGLWWSSKKTHSILNSFSPQKKTTIFFPNKGIDDTVLRIFLCDDSFSGKIPHKNIIFWICWAIFYQIQFGKPFNHKFPNGKKLSSSLSGFVFLKPFGTQSGRKRSKSDFSIVNHDKERTHRKFPCFCSCFFPRKTFSIQRLLSGTCHLHEPWPKAVPKTVPMDEVMRCIGKVGNFQAGVDDCCFKLRFLRKKLHNDDDGRLVLNPCILYWLCAFATRHKNTCLFCWKQQNTLVWVFSLGEKRS